MVSIFPPSFSQKKLERKKDKKAEIGHEPKNFLAFFFFKFRISGPKNLLNQVFEPLEGLTQKFKNDPQETWPNPSQELSPWRL